MGRKGIPGLSFSWKRAVGVSAAKSRLSRQIGIPLTRQGRQRKAGHAMGCCAPFVAMVLGTAAIAAFNFAIVGDAVAHSGGLDRHGCHTNRKTGDYHCHRKPADVTPQRQSLVPGQQLRAGSGEVYYANCTEARAAGAAPLERADPGYRSAMDRDGDGVACE